MRNFKAYGNKEVICTNNNYYVHEMENPDLCKQGCVDAAECWYIVICHFDINVNMLMLCSEVYSMYGLKLFISMILDYESTFAFTGTYSDGLKVKSISRFSLAELVCTNKLSSLLWGSQVLAGMKACCEVTH